MNRLAGRADVVDEVHGFKYFDERDLLGFVDGTENPTGLAAARRGDHRRRGSRLRRRQLRDRAEVPARPDDVERDLGRGAGAGHRPHEARRHRAARRGQADQLARRAEHDRRRRRRGAPDRPGQHAVRHGSARASSARTSSATPPRRASPSRCCRTCSSASPPGNYDRILDFSTAVTGSLFFVPSADFLDDPPDAPSAAAGTVADPGRGGRRRSARAGRR